MYQMPLSPGGKRARPRHSTEDDPLVRNVHTAQQRELEAQRRIQEKLVGVADQCCHDQIMIQKAYDTAEQPLGPW